MSGPEEDSEEGSPPRVRGKPPMPWQRYASARLTPACAGKTPATRSVMRRCGAHPRVCGENRAGVVRVVKRVGSPPRVRGKLAAAEGVRK